MSTGIKDTKRKRNNMHKLEKLILETYSSILKEEEELSVNSKSTYKMDDLPKALQDRLERQYGKFHPKDFVSSDMTTYFKTSEVNKTTGSVGHTIIRLPSFQKMYADFHDIVQDIKNLMKSDDVRKDPAARELFELIKTNFRKLQRYLRIERPEQYAMLRQQTSLQELVNMFNTHITILKEQNGSRDAKKSNITEERKYSHEEEDRLDLIAHKLFGPDFMKLDAEQKKEVLKQKHKVGVKEAVLKEAIAKFKSNSNITTILESMLDDISEEEEPEETPVPEEEPDMGAPEETVLEDATDKILGKFPTVRAAIVKLQTEDFKEFVESIDWISPRPTAFRVNLKNGQDYILKWTGKTFEAQILGKRYMLSNIAEYQQALDKLAILYKEAPMSGAGEGEPADTDSGSGGGGGGDFPGGEGGAEGGEEGDAVDALGGDDTGGEEGGGADLGGEEIDFEDGAEPEA